MNNALVVALLVGGVALLGFAMSSCSLSLDFSRFLSGPSADKAIAVVARGALATALGLVLVLRGVKSG